jgi:hypothetical protein
LGVVDDFVGTQLADEVELEVLATPVTLPPYALTSCTMKLPTPPEAPMTSDR